MTILNKRFMGRAASVLGLTVMCSAFITPVPAIAEASKVVTGSECADYTVIGMRGSDTADIEKQNGRNRSEEDLSPIGSAPNSVYAFASEALRTTAPNDKTIKYSEVLYSPVDEYIGFGGTLHAKPDDYKKAIEEGSKKFVEEAQKITSSCSNTNVILFGYGQGAGVMRVSLEKLNPKTRDSIKAVWFMSDTMHDGSGADGFEYWDAYTGWDESVNGFMRLSAAYFEAERVADEKDEEEKKVKLRDTLPAPVEQSIPSGLKSKVLSMCDGKDGFCSPSEDVNIMIDSSPWHYVKKGYLEYGSKRIFEIASGVSLDDSKADGEVRSNYNAQIVHKGVGATWVVEKEHQPELVTNCISDFAIIGVRGSGEDIEGGKGEESGIETRGGMPSQEGAIRIRGFSDILATAAWGIKENLPQDSTVRFIPVSYPAQSVEEMIRAQDMYRTSIDQGKNLTLEATRNILDLCPLTKVILMGYSQGSLSSHLALKELGKDHLVSLGGAYLIADPIRDHEDEAISLQYDENSGTGFAQIGKSPLMTTNGVARRLTMYPERVDKALHGKVLEICHTGDGVCNGSTLGGYGDIHPHVYKEKSQFWGFPTQWAASKLVRARSTETLPQFSKANDSVFELTDEGYRSAYFNFEHKYEGRSH